METELLVNHLSCWYPADEWALLNAKPVTGKLVDKELGENRHPLKLPACSSDFDLTWVPAMQRRRMSRFARMALHCAHQTASRIETPLSSVFATRHGDLHRTSVLIGNVAKREPLSPNAFSLSVHNAVAGLFTILSKNTLPTTTISAGPDTFAMALIEAYAKLQAGVTDKMLLVHTDQALPEIYSRYQDEKQIDHALAMCLSLGTEGAQEGIRISVEGIDCLSAETGGQSSSALDQARDALPQALQFLTWMAAGESQGRLTSPSYYWRLSRHAA